MKILFLQLPCLDNEVGRHVENMPMAGFYLAHSLVRTGAAEGIDFLFLEREEEFLDDAHILHLLLDRHPDVICCTLYLWNIERTLHLLKKIKRADPDIRIVAGGPEVSLGHPFLFRSLLPDVAVAGEGEGVFPLVVRALRKREFTDLRCVGWRKGHRYLWGEKVLAAPSLEECLPPPDHPGWVPDDQGTAYIETGRGCPMSCAYCRYAQLRKGMTFLGPQELTRRIRVLRNRGAREIRFVDPTLNANPAFRPILKNLARLNQRDPVRLFGEVRAETLLPEDIADMRSAGFSEIEVGVQSRDPKVLRLIHRPADQDALEENLRRMISEGIEVTLDLMYGLPGQTLEDVAGSLRWARDLGPGNLQCLQTLLLPGTELRKNRRRWGVLADPLPPYAVRSTRSLSWEEIRGIEELIHEISPADCMTHRFAGYRLDDLFAEKVVVHLGRKDDCALFKGSSSRRAVLFRGEDLFGAKTEICRIIGEAVRAEPHMLWQFVLNPEREFPLDLLEAMISRLREFPPQWIDRFASIAAWNRISSRRIFVLLRPGFRRSLTWIRAAESLLEDHFY
ncbi:MAG: radical SAM protein [Desulfobacteraceae bacterium]|nr:MAG: radical SAM protein [Desulfobacteraceae bacterium]